jgi:hypothetical protein
VKNLKSLKILAVLAGLLAFNGLAYAGICDLTIDNAECTINTAIFQQVDDQATGTGLVDPFVRISPGGNDTTEQGYNTTLSEGPTPVLNTDFTDQYNHELLLADVPQVEIDGVWYYEFVLDINENVQGPGDNEFLSLDEVQLFQTSIGNQNVTSFAAGDPNIIDINGDLVYDLDSNADNVVLLNYLFEHGSGSGDMNMYIPVSAFDGEGEYVILYSAFGYLGEDPNNIDGYSAHRNYSAADGFEEWTHREATTPIPAVTAG